MIRIGFCRTFPVVGRYWINSPSSSRCTTHPGVAARSVPTWKALRSVCEGIPPLWRTSPHHCFAPRATLLPPVSKARLSAAGFVGRKFVGAMADWTMFMTKRARSASCQLRSPSSRSSTSRSIDSTRLRYSWPSRRKIGLLVQAGSENRRSPLAGARVDFPARMRTESRPNRRTSRTTLRGWPTVTATLLSRTAAVGIPTASPASTSPRASSSVRGSAAWLMPFHPPG